MAARFSSPDGRRQRHALRDREFSSFWLAARVVLAIIAPYSRTSALDALVLGQSCPLQPRPCPAWASSLRRTHLPSDEGREKATAVRLTMLHDGGRVFMGIAPAADAAAVPFARSIGDAAGSREIRAAGRHDVSRHRQVRRSWPEEGRIGRGRGIRTSDPLLPKQMRYQTAPCPDAPASYEGVPGRVSLPGRRSPVRPATCQICFIYATVVIQRSIGVDFAHHSRIAIVVFTQNDGGQS